MWEAVRNQGANVKENWTRKKIREQPAQGLKSANRSWQRRQRRTEGELRAPGPGAQSWASG